MKERGMNRGREQGKGVESLERNISGSKTKIKKRNQGEGEKGNWKRV